MDHAKTWSITNHLVYVQEQYRFIHEAILETILCGMNEVDSTKIINEVEQLAKVKASGMTGFQEKFKVFVSLDNSFRTIHTCKLMTIINKKHKRPNHSDVFLQF